jgi:glucose/arabinose dehydrogenase/plastocyanin
LFKAIEKEYNGEKAIINQRNMKKIIFIVIIVLVVAAAAYMFIRNKGQQAPENGLVREIGLSLVAQGFVSPVALVSANDGTGRMFLVDQIGLIKIINSQGEVLSDNFLDLRGKLAALSANYDEKGLLGLAFHPDFAQNGRFFVYYSAPLRQGALLGWDHTSRLSEFTVSQSNQNVADPASERIILQIDEPQMNHNGGHIAFGPDGYLYVPLGDGGQANDSGIGHSATGNGQDISTLLGKVLRIDVNSGNPYSVPEDNPFVGKDGMDEIFAFGFRNPYHISFDSANGKLFVADVGQNLWEEVDIVKKGGNYGWNIKEGKHCFDPTNPDQSPAECAGVGAGGEALIDPIFEYGRDLGVANVGGYVYRGEAIKELEGNYIFADWSKGFSGGDGSIFAAVEGNGEWVVRELAIANKEGGKLGLYIKGVGQDERGELYILTTENLGPDGNSGKVFRIVPIGSSVENNVAGVAEETVLIKNFSFSPSEITVSAGTKVTWRNEDSIKHTATRQGTFDSGLLAKGEEYSFVFEVPGTFDYICTPHPFMKGKVIVE